MKITDILKRQKPCFSFEFFPPKTEEGMNTLFGTIAALEALNPAFVSVTYGAGGSTRELTLELVTRIKKESAIETMAHFTCVGSERDGLVTILDRMASIGIENVLALRGDPPKGETEFKPEEDGLGHANELIEFIRGRGYDFCIGAACYPEPHPESRGNKAFDLRNLGYKVQAGAEFLITQLFFDNTYYFDFVHRARQAGIDVPIIPGIMPITNVAQIERFTRMCGATIPGPLSRALHERVQEPEAVVQLGVAYATAQCEELLRCGAPGIHFYTLNKSTATRAILSALQIHKPWLGSTPE